MKHGSILLLTILFFFSCKNQSHSENRFDPYALKLKADTAITNSVDTTYLDIKGNHYKYLGSIPDSLRTSEQQTLINLISEVTVKYITTKDNHMVFELTKEQFVAKGIPEKYYYLTLKNIRDNNLFIDKNGIKNV